MRLRSAIVLAGVLCGARAAQAASTCDGPAECCPKTLVEQAPKHEDVGLGVVIIGLYNLNEHAGTWDADYYLYESWAPQDGFMPQTEVVNEVSRASEQFDDTELKSGRCVRSRRIRSTLHTPYNLRLFPFDQQHLVLELSDANYAVGSASYGDKAYIGGIDSEARQQLSQWEISGDLKYTHVQRAFQWEEGAPTYDYATFSVPVKRHITFHLTKFFLPLLVIVIVSFAMFFIDPEDLNSQVGVGVTCLLAAIAFQLAQASTLPEVAYLTLADRIYSICYVAIALAMAESVYTNTLARAGKKDDAHKVDRLCRVLFPTGMVVATLVSIAISYMQSK